MQEKRELLLLVDVTFSESTKIILKFLCVVSEQSTDSSVAGTRFKNQLKL